jgi:methionine-rich copper-binding protein CopC
LNIYYSFSKSEELDVQIVNSTGQTIASNTIAFEANDNKVDVFLKENLATGVYFVKLTNASVSYTSKFIVVNR